MVPLTPTPPADEYVPRARVGQPQAVFGLDLYFCGACTHLQLLDIVPPDLLFPADYSFLSGASPAIVKHFREYSSALLAQEQPAPGALVVDIGSNDGTFLGFFRAAGLSVLGIDPATDLAARASASGTETWPTFFSTAVAQRIRDERGPARLITANNVFAHADDLGGMADAVRLCLAADGAFVFEVSYVVDVVEHMLLGTIFHEHVCYHAVRPLRAFLRRHGLELVNVERNALQGGSIIGTAQHIGGPRSVAAVVDELDRMELERHMNDAETYRAFGRKIEALKTDVAKQLDQIAAEGKIVAGFGAARSGTTFLCHFDLGKHLRFLVDDNPAKQGLFSPLHHIPVLPSTALYEHKPDYVFILAWVHASSIMQKHRAFLEAGGHFITPCPIVKIV